MLIRKLIITTYPVMYLFALFETISKQFIGCSYSSYLDTWRFSWWREWIKPRSELGLTNQLFLLLKFNLAEDFF